MPLRYWVFALFSLFISNLSNGQKVGASDSVDLLERRNYRAVFTSDFSNRKDLRRWDKRPSRKWVKLAKDSIGNSILQVRSRAGSSLLQKELPISEIAGRKLLVRVRLRSDSIVDRSAAYKGVKLCLHIVTPQGHLYPQLQMPNGPISWQNAGFTAFIPSNASACTLLLGIEDATGQVQFDDLSVHIFPPQSDTLPVRQNQQPAITLRGTMIATNATAADLRVLAAWGANHIRWQLTWDGFPDSPADLLSVDEYNKWLQRSLAHVKALMPLCDTLGLNVILDLHTLPGGRRRFHPGQEHRIFHDKVAQEAFRDAWKDIVLQFRNEPALWGYDLANEPIEGYLPDSLLDWQALAAATAADIRQLDTQHYIVLQGAPTGSPEVLPGLYPIHDNRTVYSCHTYEPALFTHQGLFGLPAGLQYPGVIDGRTWDKEALIRFLQPVRDWQLQHRVPIYVGEFSAVRWAPDSSAYRYLRDCIEIFEAWGWSWAYHAFRESHVWSLEHGNNPDNTDPSPAPTDRLLLLQEYFTRNRPLR